jgi:hypothetical protein
MPVAAGQVHFHQHNPPVWHLAVAATAVLMGKLDFPDLLIRAVVVAQVARLLVVFQGQAAAGL